MLLHIFACAIFAFVNGRCRLEQSLPFRTLVYCGLHEEDQVVIADIQLILTPTLHDPNPNLKQRNSIDKNPKSEIKNMFAVF